MNIEQERAAFEAWAASIGFCVTGKYAETIDVLCAESAFKAGYQAGRAAMQSQPTEAFPCRIVETDFEANTVTLEMQGKYTVSSGQKYLCDVPLYSHADFNCKGKLDGSNHVADAVEMETESDE